MFGGKVHVIIVSIQGGCTKVTQRKRWVIKKDSMKPILLLSDWHCANSKFHLIVCKSGLPRGGLLCQPHHPINTSFLLKDPLPSDSTHSV